VTDFVLIHSTGEAPSCWERLVRALGDRGLSARAVDLPTDQPDLEVDDYSEIMRQQVGANDRPIVVAHSGSGVLLPAASRSLNARHRVWLAAWVPDPNASFLEEARDTAAQKFNPAWVGKDPTADESVAIEFLYHDCDQATIDWALTTRRLFLPLAVYNQRIPFENDLPSTYVVASLDRTILPEWQRRMARDRLGVEPIEIATGHLPHVSQPDSLAEILATID
jgi:pimeloyl-ACP methyl ester carboxylesterase